MARSISEIFNSILAEKQTLNTLSSLVENSSSNALSPYLRLLADVNSSSTVAVWRLWAFVVAVIIWIHEKMWDVFKAEIQDLADQAISGNIPWYLRQIFAFQYGYDMVFLNNKFKYQTIDETAKIIKRAAIVEADGELRIKVAKLDNSDKPIPLTGLEKTSFSAYIAKIKFAGTKVLIISEVADDLSFDQVVYYNPLIGIDAVIANTEKAITDYLDNLEFNGAFNVTKYIDSLQAADGVEDILIINVSSRYGMLPFTNIVRQTIPNSGYFNVVGGLPLSNRVTNADGSVTTSNNSGVTVKYVPNVQL